MKKTKIYSIWNEMRCRCQNPNDKNYKNYGLKGISVCDEWSDFRNFHSWAIGNGYIEGLSIDRINPYGNYEPENCRWITRGQQQRNRSNNIKIEHDGMSLTIGEWCEKLDFSYASAKSRYYRKIKTCGEATFDDLFGKKPNYRSKKIGQYTLDGELVKVWDKMAEIRKSGIANANVTKCCQGKIKKTHGFVWRYID